MWTYIGPFGNLLQIKCPVDPVPANIVRSGTEQFTLDGYRFVQRPPVALRSWELSFEFATPDDIAPLIALDYGVYGPPPWHWYNPAAAKVNMLTPWQSSPGIPGPEVWSPGATDLEYIGPNILQITATAVSAETTSPVPVLPGRTYMASAQMLDRPGGTTTAVLSLRWVDAAGALVSSVSSAATVSPNRAVVSGVAPPTAAGAVLRVTPTAATTGRFGSALLVEGAADVPWHIGMGAESVTVMQGLGHIYREVYDDLREGVVSQVAATLLEVQSA